jgi:hypothetical protein
MWDVDKKQSDRKSHQVCSERSMCASFPLSRLVYVIFLKKNSDHPRHFIFFMSDNQSSHVMLLSNVLFSADRRLLSRHITYVLLFEKVDDHMESLE